MNVPSEFSALHVLVANLSMVNDPLAHCIGLLRAQSDEQRFVGLLLATKLVRTPSDLARVFDVALPFVRRLLLTPSGVSADQGDAVSGPSYRGLALSVLASFVSDPDVSTRPELASKLCLPAHTEA